MNTHPFDLKFVAFCPKFNGDSYSEVHEKSILREFFRNIRANQGYPLPKLVKFRWKESLFVCETVWFFCVGEYSSVWHEIFRSFSQHHWRYFRGILRKNYFGRIFQNILCKPRLSSTKTCVKFRPTFEIFILRSYCVENMDASTFICCLHPGKEART